MGSGIFGTNILSGHGFFGFDPTPNASAVNTVRNMTSGNFTTAPDTNARTSTSTAQPAGALAATGTNTQSFPQVLGSSSSTGGVSTTQAQNADIVNRLFDIKQSALQDQLGAIDPQEQAANLQLQNQYTNSLNGLQTGFDQGTRNLGLARNQVAEKKAQSLADLQRQIQGMHMGYNAQLGSMGAGDSSAAALVNQALAGQASRNRGDVLHNATDQNQQIDFQEADLKTSFDQNKKALDDWKQSTLNDLIGNFAQQRAQIRTAMQDADLNRQQQLAQYDASLTQSVLDRLTQIEQASHQATADLVTRYQQAFVPKDIAIAPELQQYQVQPIQPGQVAGLNIPGNQNSNEAANETALRKRYEDEQKALLGGL